MNRGPAKDPRILTKLSFDLQQPLITAQIEGSIWTGDSADLTIAKIM
jgi:hypothetical protein